MTEPATYAPPADAVWTCFDEALPEVDDLIYVRGDGDFRGDVPYKFAGRPRGLMPRLRALLLRGRLVPGDDDLFPVLPRAEWTPTEVPTETPAPSQAPPPTTYAPPTPDAVWRTFGDACPKVGDLVYVRGDRDFREDVPYTLLERGGPRHPALGVELTPDGGHSRDADERLAPGYDDPFPVLCHAFWTPAAPAAVPEAPSEVRWPSRVRAAAVELQAALAEVPPLRAGAVSDLHFEAKEAVGRLLDLYELADVLRGL